MSSIGSQSIVEVREYKSAYAGLHDQDHARGIVFTPDEAVPDEDALEGEVSADHVVGQRMAKTRGRAAPIAVAPDAVGGCPS